MTEKLQERRCKSEVNSYLRFEPIPNGGSSYSNFSSGYGTFKGEKQLPDLDDGNNNNNSSEDEFIPEGEGDGVGGTEAAGGGAGADGDNISAAATLTFTGKVKRRRRSRATMALLNSANASSSDSSVEPSNLWKVVDYHALMKALLKEGYGNFTAMRECMEVELKSNASGLAASIVVASGVVVPAANVGPVSRRTLDDVEEKARWLVLNLIFMSSLVQQFTPPLPLPLPPPQVIVLDGADDIAPPTEVPIQAQAEAADSVSVETTKVSPSVAEISNSSSSVKLAADERHLSDLLQHSRFTKYVCTCKYCVLPTVCVCVCVCRFNICRCFMMSCLLVHLLKEKLVSIPERKKNSEQDGNITSSSNNNSSSSSSSSSNSSSNSSSSSSDSSSGLLILQPILSRADELQLLSQCFHCVASESTTNSCSSKSTVDYLNLLDWSDGQLHKLILHSAYEIPLPASFKDVELAFLQRQKKNAANKLQQLDSMFEISYAMSAHIASTAHKSATAAVSGGSSGDAVVSAAVPYHASLSLRSFLHERLTVYVEDQPRQWWIVDDE